MKNIIGIYYTYLIGWSTHNKWYYGRRTKAGCEPAELWVTYFTSSRWVKSFRQQHGEPDVVEVRRVFDNPLSCAAWESTVLRRMNAASHPNMLNRTNGDKRFDTSGTALAVTPAGIRVGMVSVTDPRWLDGSIISITKYNGKSTGMCNAIETASGKKLGRVPINDPRWALGEIHHHSKGIATNRAAARDAATGELLGVVSLDDPRWASGEIQSALKGREVSESTRSKQSAVRKGREGTFTGKKHTDDSKRKIGSRSYENQTGGNHTGSRGVWIDDVLIPTVSQAAKYIGMDESELRKILKGQRHTVPKIFKVKNITAVRYDDQ